LKPLRANIALFTVLLYFILPVYKAISFYVQIVITDDGLFGISVLPVFWVYLWDV